MLHDSALHKFMIDIDIRIKSRVPLISGYAHVFVLDSIVNDWKPRKSGFTAAY